MSTTANLPAVPVTAPPAVAGSRPDPYRAYLNRLGSPASQRVMAGCLDRLAYLCILLEPYSPAVELNPDGLRAAAGQLREADLGGLGAGQPWWLLRAERTVQLRAVIASPEFGWAPAYVNKHLSALRGVLKESWRLGVMGTDDYLRAKDVPNVKGKRVMAGRSIHPDEMAAMLASCEAQDGPLRCRDSAMLMLLQSTGMRRDEITSALIEDWDPRERCLLVTGKGNKQRRAWIHKAVVPFLDRWLALVGERTGPVFRAVDRWGNIKPGGISDDAVYLTVNRHRQRAGLPPLSPHDFRRTFVGELYDAGGDSQQARKLAGHEQSSTTDKYDRRGDRGLRDLVDSLPIVLPPDPPPQPAGAST